MLLLKVYICFVSGYIKHMVLLIVLQPKRELMTSQTPHNLKQIVYSCEILPELLRIIQKASKIVYQQARDATFAQDQRKTYR